MKALMIKTVCWTICFSSMASANVAPDLQVGIVKTEENRRELTETTSPAAYAYGTAMLTHRNLDDSGVSAFLVPEGTHKVVSLSRSRRIYVTNLDDDSVLGNWYLTRWKHDYLPEKVITRYVEHGRTGNDAEGSFTLPLHNATNTLFGCLASAPLRYGDVFGGDRNELVLWLGYNFIIFSLEQGETLFSQRMSIDDWLDREATDEFVDYVPGGVQSDQPQFQSRIIAETTANFQAPVPGYRGYAKLFFGSFSDTDSRDILIWHKLYESRRESDPIQGFRKIEDTYRHVMLRENDDGSVKYVLAETKPETIQSWLSDNELTWSDGYPRLSECPGEEGELISEMHDPLLNDPDVLPAQP